jgi:hypothetical protein
MGPRTIFCDLGDLAEADAGTIDALARLQLAVRRRGFELRLLRAPTEFVCLLELTGLSEVLRLEPGREPEKRENAVRVEKERQLDDPAVRDLDHLQGPRIEAVPGLARLVLAEGGRAVRRARRDHA